MTQSLWESEVYEEPQPVSGGASLQEAELFHSAEESSFDFQPELAVESDAEPEQNHFDAAVEAPHAGEASLSLSVDEFTALEERILRAVSLLKAERVARAAAEERALQLEAQLQEQAPLTESLQKEISSLYAERDHVRLRVERLLTQLDALEV